MPPKSRDEYLKSVSEQQRKSRFKTESWPRRVLRASLPVIGQAFALYAGIAGALVTLVVLWLLVGVPPKLATMIGLGAGIAIAFGWRFLFDWFEEKV